MNTIELFERCLQQATNIIDQLQPRDYAKATPEPVWNVRSLANHMLMELSRLPDVLAGESAIEIGNKYDGDLIGDDLQAHWHEAAALARGEIRLADLSAKARAPFGRMSNDAYLRQVARGLLIHSWDLAAATGVRQPLDAEAAETVYDSLLPVSKNVFATGLFDSPKPVGQTTDIQTKLLALLGRDVGWRSL